MEEVVHGPRGTAKAINKNLSYRIAAKTGTAQVVGIAQNATYDSAALERNQRDHALFVAFAPVGNPRIAVAVIIENGEHGSTTAAPVARKVMDAYLLPRDDASGTASPAPPPPAPTAVRAEAAPSAQDPATVAIPAADAESAPEEQL